MRSRHKSETKFESLLVGSLRFWTRCGPVLLMLLLAVTALAQDVPPPNPPPPVATVEVAPAKIEAADADGKPTAQLEVTEQEVADDPEVEEAQAMAVVGNPWGVEPKKMLAAKHFQLSQIFQVEVDQIEQVCQLDKKQLLKLKIGAKGAVKKLAEQWQKTAGQQFGMAAAVELELDADVEGEKSETPETDQETIEITDADQIDEMTMQLVMTDQMGNPFKTPRPTESDIWTKMIRGVLTDGQSQTWTDFQRDQAVAKRTAMIAFVVASLTQELALSADQRTTLESLVTPQLATAEIKCIGFYEAYVMYYHVSKVSKKDLQGFLSPAQYQQFQLFVAPSKQIGQMMETEEKFMIDIDGSGINLIEGVLEGIGELLDGIGSFFTN